MRKRRWLIVIKVRRVHFRRKFFRIFDPRLLYVPSQQLREFRQIFRALGDIERQSAIDRGVNLFRHLDAGGFCHRRIKIGAL
ncbi:MAG TPA: hypothetical protein PKB01_03015, partial [Xanthobacteraceae bacterium]|nr:hypothetical protein [Xanthobacteraceae bacterium]